MMGTIHTAGDVDPEFELASLSAGGIVVSVLTSHWTPDVPVGHVHTVAVVVALMLHVPVLQNDTTWSQMCTSQKALLL